MPPTSSTCNMVSTRLRLRLLTSWHGGQAAQLLPTCSAARHEWLCVLGFPCQEFADRGLALAVSQIDIKCALLSCSVALMGER